ncbi:FecR family protein [Poseidonocella sp. HB161398]|uniref:FecR family protein n=1 Tax=Poseidonocella sp. HB161398 TaxID=2320855 RepID=UPI001486D899|nr:FecR domain-containing protein [Poseidonocella sp. HB161398]
MSIEDLAAEDPEAEAAAWVVRLGDAGLDGAARAEAEAEFAAWLAQGPLQRAAYAEAEALWGALGQLDAADLVPAPAGALPAAAARPRRLVRAAAVLALAGIAAVAGTAFWYGNPAVLMQADYLAGRGGLREVALPDGSQAELASGSAIRVAYDGAARKVELLRGTGYFIAAPQTEAEPRPFVVEAEGVTATALGTEFMVAIAPDSLSVLVTRHSVRVSAGPEQLTLPEDHEVRFAPGTGFSAVETGTADFATAWRRGLLIFDDRPLGDVVEELNRYRHGKIVIRSASLAARRVSGVFDITRIDEAVDHIARDLDLGVFQLPPMVTVLY